MIALHDRDVIVGMSAIVVKVAAYDSGSTSLPNAVRSRRMIVNPSKRKSVVRGGRRRRRPCARFELNGRGPRCELHDRQHHQLCVADRGRRQDHAIEAIASAARGRRLNFDPAFTIAGGDAQACGLQLFRPCCDLERALSERSRRAASETDAISGWSRLAVV